MSAGISFFASIFICFGSQALGAADSFDQFLQTDDPYLILGLRRESGPTEEQISQAHRRLIKSTHPDIAGQSERALEAAKKINTARDILLAKQSLGLSESERSFEGSRTFQLFIRTVDLAWGKPADFYVGKDLFVMNYNGELATNRPEFFEGAQFRSSNGRFLGWHLLNLEWISGEMFDLIYTTYEKGDTVNKTRIRIKRQDRTILEVASFRNGGWSSFKDLYKIGETTGTNPNLPAELATYRKSCSQIHRGMKLK